MICSTCDRITVAYYLASDGEELCTSCALKQSAAEAVASRKGAL